MVVFFHLFMWQVLLRCAGITRVMSLYIGTKPLSEIVVALRDFQGLCHEYGQPMV